MTVRPAGLAGSRGQARARTREAVLEAALRLFSEHGYLGVRVEDIAREAGVSRATFYKHFAEREEILAMLLSRLLGSDDDVAPGAEPSPAGDLASRVRTLAQAIVARMLDQEQLARFVYSLPVRHDALLHNQPQRLPSAFRRVDQLIEDARTAGEIRDDVPAELVNAHVHAAIETAMREWATGRVTDPYRRLDQHLDLVLRGAMSPAPPRRRRRS